MVDDVIRAERLGLVERLRGLPPDDWDRPSLCAGWSVRHVLAHLTTPFLVSRPRMLAQFATSRGISAGMNQAASRLAERPSEDLLGVLAANAGSTFRPPMMPSAAPLTEVVVHGADIRWAVGDDHTDWGDPARLRPVLGFLTGMRAWAGFVPPQRLKGIRLISEDQNWSRGAGAEVAGPSLALAMAALGRSAALPHVHGDGVSRLFRQG